MEYIHVGQFICKQFMKLRGKANSLWLMAFVLIKECQMCIWVLQICFHIIANPSPTMGPKDHLKHFDGVCVIS